MQTCTSEQYFNVFKHPRKKYFCNRCGKEYLMSERHSIYCSEECKVKSRHEKLSIIAKRNKAGGLKPETTHKNYKRGYYKGIWCDSSWELAYLLYCFDHGIQVERNKQYLEYTFEDNIFKFYPDFIVNGKMVEIKGFYTPKNKAKKEQFPDVLFIDKIGIKPYLKYAIDTYGKDFINLYEIKKQ